MSIKSKKSLTSKTPIYNPLEADEQEVVVNYCDVIGIKFSAIPNNTYTPSAAAKARNTKQGLRPGLPDLLLIIKNQLLFIEMKRRHGTTVSPDQRKWHIALNAAGIPTYVCHGADEALQLIDQYLQGLSHP